MNHYFTQSQQAGARLFCAGILALLLCMVCKKDIASLRNIPRGLMVFYVVTSPVFLILYTYAVTTTAILTAIVAFYASSLCSAVLIGKFAFNEEIHKYRIASIVLAVIGVVIYGWTKSELIQGRGVMTNVPFEFGQWPILENWTDLGFVLGVLAGMADAANNTSKRLVKGRADRLVLTIPALLAGGFIALLLSVIKSEEWKVFDMQIHIQWHALGWLALYSVLIVAVSYLTLYGFAHLSISRGSVILVSEIPLTLLFAWIVFDEVPSSHAFLGSLIVLCAVACAAFEPLGLDEVDSESPADIPGEIA